MWILLAFFASMFWGVNYVLGEQIYKRVSVTTYLGIICLCTSMVMLIIGFFKGVLKNDYIEIISSKKLLFLVSMGAMTFLIAELLIGFSIHAKNATLSGLIEISYPIFIALFSFLFFKNYISPFPTIIGGVFIFIGAIIISIFNK